MLSYQSLEITGMIHSIDSMISDGASIAHLKTDSFNDLLRIPLEDGPNYKVGDMITVNVHIDRISNLSSFHLR